MKYNNVLYSNVFISYCFIVSELPYFMQSPQTTSINCAVVGIRPDFSFWLYIIKMKGSVLLNSFNSETFTIILSRPSGF